MAETKPIVDMEGITITFPGVKALDGVSFKMYPGEVHSLMGENGAGKSTLIKALTGVYTIDDGSIKVGGVEQRFAGTGDAERAGISTVYQEVNLATNLSIGENLMLGHEKRNKLGIDWKASHKVAHEALEQVGLGYLDTHAQLSSISIAMQQLVAIARASVVKAKVLILDEPTSSLDENEVQRLFDIIRKLKSEGVAILFVSHFLDQVYEISDRMTVLRNGKFVGEYLVKDTPREQTISLMIGKSMESLSDLEGGVKQTLDEYKNHEPVLEVTQIGRRGEIQPVDLTIRPGEILGFAGLLGSGRTELARLLFGADKPDTGTYKLEGNTLTVSSPYIALKNGVAYSTEDRRDEGILSELSVRENMILALQAIRGWAHPISRKEQEEICTTYIKALSIKTPSTETPIKSLSGGNQQKVLLARWLATSPKVLILDEPTRGIDIGAKSEIQETIVQLARQGKAIVFISSELSEVVRISSRVLILKDRKKVAEVENTPDFTQGNIVKIIAQGGVNENVK